MSKKLENIKIGIDEDLEEKLAWLSPHWSDYRILKKSVDARQRHSPHFVYSFEIAENGEKLTRPDLTPTPMAKNPSVKPIIVGTGPGGLFSALRLAERGIPSILFERGSPAEQRIQSINKHWRYGQLDLHNNVCFGEGGAGLYSDGKLITRIKSPFIPYVMQKLVQMGAPAEIEYLANPHVGSDKIRRLIPSLRKYLIEKGCEFKFNSPVQELLLEGNKVCGVRTSGGEKFRSPFVVLATGHSATDILDHLRSVDVAMEAKSFAMGLRIEHPQGLINKIQFREHAQNKNLGAAAYKLTDHDSKTNTGVYSFCMCPGGYVLSSSTEEEGVVSNGMSNYNRNSPFANAAIVVTIDAVKSFGSNNLWGGMTMRQNIEQAAFEQVLRAGGRKELPGQRLMNFVEGKLGSLGSNSSLSGSVPVDLNLCLPNQISENIKKSLAKFNRKMPGFLHPEAHVFGVETRTSCPVRILRDENSLESISHPGLFPCGEGAGYAGGITSAAVDGVKIADQIADQIAHQLDNPHNPQGYPQLE